MNGAATNPDAHVVAYAGAQVKKGLEVAKRLNAECFGMDLYLLATCMHTYSREFLWLNW